jgi:hypothetical protein
MRDQVFKILRACLLHAQYVADDTVASNSKPYMIYCDLANEGVWQRAGLKYGTRNLNSCLITAPDIDLPLKFNPHTPWSDHRLGSSMAPANSTVEQQLTWLTALNSSVHAHISWSDQVHQQASIYTSIPCIASQSKMGTVSAGAHCLYWNALGQFSDNFQHPVCTQANHKPYKMKCLCITDIL